MICMSSDHLYMWFEFSQLTTEISVEASIPLDAEPKTKTMIWNTQ